MGSFGGWGWGTGGDMPYGVGDEEAAPESMVMEMPIEMVIEPRQIEEVVLPGKMEQIWNLVTEAIVGVPRLMISDFKEMVNRLRV